MNHKELQVELARRLGITQKAVAPLLEATASVVVDTLQENTSLSLSGLGVLEVRKKQDRVLVNPVSKQKMVIPPKLALTFKVSSSFKNKLKNLPARGK